MRSGRQLKWVVTIVLLLAVSCLTLASMQQTAPTDLLKTAEEMVQNVSRLRGLTPKTPVKMGVKSKEEIAKFLNEHVQDTLEVEELVGEGKMLHKVGLIPPSMDYKEFTLKLLTEQVGGYYDPEKKTFFIADWLPVDQQKPVMAHELTHALQDQHFDLQKYTEEERKLHNDDKVLARQAIFEGDAMAVMLDFLLEPAKRNFASLPDLVFIMRSQFELMDEQFAVFKIAPVYMKETLLFPYGYGAAFLQKLWAKSPSWDAVNKLYGNLPVSSEQVMHPEKYLETRDDPKPVAFEDPVQRLGEGWKAVYRNVLGEFTIDLLLRVELSEAEASKASIGWGGDQVLLLENESGADAVFAATTWDTSDDAEEFYQAMSDWLQRRYSKARKTKESPNGFGLIAGGEYHMLQRDGLNVRFLLGLPEADAAKLK